MTKQKLLHCTAMPLAANRAKSHTRSLLNFDRLSPPMDDEVNEGKLFATFEKHAEFLSAQELFLSLDFDVEPTPEEDKKEDHLFRKLSDIVGLSVSPREPLANLYA